MNTEIEKEDLIKIKAVIEEFAVLHDEFDLYEAKLEEIHKVQSEILENIMNINERITSIREKETELISSLKEKYGEEFQVDPKLFENL
jgi:hypothetical protein